MRLRLRRNDASAGVQAKHRENIRAAQTRLLYGNTNTGTLATIVAVSALGSLQWASIDHSALLLWALYMMLIVGARFILVHCYQYAPKSGIAFDRWLNVFVIGAGLAGTGWGAAGILLYPEGQLADQVLLLFFLGGMMLGAASLLAPSAQAFLAFLVPTGLLPTIRLLWHGDQQHLMMGTLAAVFTTATVRTTWQFYRAIESSLALQFVNEEIMEDLRAAKREAEVLSQRLELRVQERTAVCLSEIASRLESRYSVGAVP